MALDSLEPFESHPHYARTVTEMRVATEALCQAHAQAKNRSRFELVMECFDCRARAFLGLITDPASERNYECWLKDVVTRAWEEYTGCTIEVMQPTSERELQKWQRIEDRYRYWVNEGFRLLAEVSEAAERPVAQAGTALTLSRWEDLEIVMTSEFQAQFKVGGQAETKTFIDVGLADDRAKNANETKPNDTWETLLEFAKNKGRVERPKGKTGPVSKLEKKVYRLRHWLRAYFGLKDDPIVLRDGYRVRFLLVYKVSDPREFER